MSTPPPPGVKLASLEQFVPPWTVRRQVSLDSLKPGHSGISTDILLFSDINLSILHYCQIHKRGLPHIAFRKNYMSRLHALLPLPVAQPQDSVSSPVLTDPVSVRQAGSAELVEESPRRTRRDRRRMRPVRVMGISTDILLFSDINLSILHYYQIHKRGLPQSRRQTLHRSSPFRIPRTRRVRWSITVGLRCSLCHCNCVIWDCCLCDQQWRRPVWLCLPGMIDLRSVMWSRMW